MSAAKAGGRYREGMCRGARRLREHDRRCLAVQRQDGERLASVEPFVCRTVVRPLVAQAADDADLAEVAHVGADPGLAAQLGKAAVGGYEQWRL